MLLYSSKTILRILWGLCFLIFTGWGSEGFLFGQNNTNPFELTARLPKVSTSATQIATNHKAPAPTGNPFDIQPSAPKVEKKTPATPRLTELIPSQKASDHERFRQFLFITLLVLLVLLTIVMTLFRSVVQISYRAFFNENILNQLHREQRGFAALPFQILYLLFFIHAGTFLFLILNRYGIKISESNLHALLLCIGGVTGVFTAKHLLLKLIGSVFPIDKEVGAYSLTIIIFNIMTGIGLVPFIIFLSYGTDSLIQPAIYLSLGLLGLVYAYRSVRGLIIANRFIAYHKFHFLLYICAVEIAPLLILFKLISNAGH